jgi:hypothetical protein
MFSLKLLLYSHKTAISNQTKEQRKRGQELVTLKAQWGENIFERAFV